MDIICQELGIPRKQIKTTKTTDRYLITVHKSWLQCLLVKRKLAEFPIYLGADEWPAAGKYSSHAWTNVYISVYKKYSHKVMSLPHCRDDSASRTTPLYFSQLLQYISYTNHQCLWKHAYKKYATRKSKVAATEYAKKSEYTKLGFSPYDTVLREVILRTYGCHIVHSQLDKLNANEDPPTDDKPPEHFSQFDAHSNLYPVIAAIETNTQYIVVFAKFTENTLLDCVTYSPAIIAKSNNKPMFIVYQLLQLVKTLHDRGVLLGNVGLGDIYMTENLWINVMPHLDANILQLDNGVSDAEATAIPPKTFNYMIKENPTYSLRDYCEMWCHGQLANFEYLTILNNLSGRRLGCAGHHHIMPWITDFVARNGSNWRDLKKSKYRLNKGDAQLDLMFQPSGQTYVPHHVSDVLSEITYYVYMARRTPKTLLCKFVRPIWVPAEYPASIQRLQEWTPDECIPEFFTDPLVFKSVHEDLPDLEVPVWASCPEDFITKHREALESQYVSERLHHWIDLNFGYKLTGSAAVRSKNVCLSLVNDHKTLCERGIVQLFTQPHPPKQYQTSWTGKTPPRIHSQLDSKRRLTRSSEDLSNPNVSPHHSPSPSRIFSYTATSTPQAQRYTSTTPQHQETITNIERSTSYHSNVQRSQNQIVLPKDYNPVAALIAVENMEVFLAKTFYHASTPAAAHPISTTGTIDYDIQFKVPPSVCHPTEDSGNSFTNRMFAETYEATLLLKDTKRLHNLQYKNQFVQQTTRNFKHLFAEQRARELQVIGCIIVEIFLAKQLRPLGSCATQSFAQRLVACLSVLAHDFDKLPKCVQYVVKLLLLSENNSQLTTKPVLTDKGLPQPSASQILQPLLSNYLLPFPFTYMKVHALLENIQQFEIVLQHLQLYTFFECDGKNCEAYESIDKNRLAVARKISECKVKSFVVQIDSLLQPIGYEQFNHIELILPHVIDMLHNDDTAALVAWYLFDSVAIALGPKQTRNYLLEPILHLYDADLAATERALLHDSTQAFSGAVSSAKSRKTVRLYNHTFLLRLMVRFGLRQFLESFVSPLIEAVGGYKEPTPTEHVQLHLHETPSSSNAKVKLRSTKHLHYRKVDSESFGTSVSADNTTVEETVEPELTSTTTASGDEMFAFEDESQTAAAPDYLSDTDAGDAILKIIDHFDLTSEGSMLDLRLNHSTAEEATECLPTMISEDKGPTSPTIPIPTFRRSTELNTIDCEIGSKKSIDSADLLMATADVSDFAATVQAATDRTAASSSSTTLSRSHSSARQNRISEMSAESLIWLIHRLGPVLTARHISRNLLKMLTLCYVGQENLLPDFSSASHRDTLMAFTIADGRVVGDRNAAKVLECLAAISALFGDQIVLLQYLPHISELIALCKKRITASLEGGLISSLQLLKYLVPCLSDAIIMDQLHDVILKSIIHPIIRLLASSRCLMPSGYLARSILARKLLDAIYVLAIRIGPEMTKEHLCVPALQRFFLIFDKAYGISDHFKNDDGCLQNDPSPSHSLDDSNFVEIRRDGMYREWTVKGSPIQISHAKRKGDTSSVDSISPPPQINVHDNNNPAMAVFEKATEEICDVFRPNLAHVAYVPFLKYLGEHVMLQVVKNPTLILSLCHEHEQPSPAVSSTPERRSGSGTRNRSGSSNGDTSDTVDSVYSNSFGSAVIGNRLNVAQQRTVAAGEQNEIATMELLDVITYKYEQINTARHLRGNWLAYWEHEIGRPEKDYHFNLKQIKLQTYAGHSNSVRSLLCLDNENSFMSASKDKTVKLWSLRSEGDGSKVSFCQFSYANHRKSVHSLAFLESLRLTISCDSGVHLWDPFVGAQVGQLDSHKLTPVSVVKTYPAPSPLVLAGTAESTLKIIDARTFAYVNEWKVSPSSSGSVRCIAVSPSGAWIAVGLSSGQLTLFDGRTGTIISSWKATEGELLQLNAPNEEQIVSSSLDHNICVWSSLDGSLLFHMKSPAEPAHCILSNGRELLFGTPANRIGIYPSVGSDIPFSITKLRSETFRGVLTSLALLPLNRLLLIGGDSGNISLLC